MENSEAECSSVKAVDGSEADLRSVHIKSNSYYPALHCWPCTIYLGSLKEQPILTISLTFFLWTLFFLFTLRLGSPFAATYFILSLLVIALFILGKKPAKQDETNSHINPLSKPYPSEADSAEKCDNPV